jgi:hypothetical protein
LLQDQALAYQVVGADLAKKIGCALKFAMTWLVTTEAKRLLFSFT